MPKAPRGPTGRGETKVASEGLAGRERRASPVRRGSRGLRVTRERGDIRVGRAVRAVQA